MGVSSFWTGDFWTDAIITVLYFIGTVSVVALATYLGIKHGYAKGG